MKSTILTLTLLLLAISTTYGQLSIFLKDRTVFHFDNETGIATNIIPTTTKFDISEIWVLKEHIIVYGPGFPTGKETKFVVKRCIHYPKSKFWNFIVSRDGVGYEIHLNLKDDYIMFVSQDSKVEYLSIRDLYNIDGYTNITKDPYWGVQEKLVSILR